ncbi:MAG: hypothetical protein K0Q55_2967 [Verrucomicrobia bacterium]|jgi:hypothetical protein|nr:hypothetical protein [Verrucomicrobiota bacterium]
MEWFYAIDKQQHGPVSAEQLAELVRQGTVTGTTLVWHKGMPEWLPYENVTAPSPGNPPSSGGAALPLPQGLPSPEEWAEQVKRTPANLSIGECFGKGWEMFQQNMAIAIGTSLLVFLAFLAVGFVPFAHFFLNGPLLGGFLYFYIMMVRGKECQVGTAFAGFGPQFVPLMLAGILIAFIGMLCILPGIGIAIAGVVSLGLFGMSANQAQDAIQAASIGAIVLMVAGVFLSILLTWLVTIFLQFTYPLIIDKKLDLMAALKLSFRRSMQNWFSLFLLLIVGGLLNFVGLLLCGVGMLFTVPWNFAAIAVAYEKLFPGETAKSSY